jgi:prevent-host-death family protein
MEPVLKIVTVHQAKTQLSKLLAEVAEGHEVMIARGATPAARLVPATPIKRRRFGALKGQVRLDDSFFEPLPADELAAWGED